MGNYDWMGKDLIRWLAWTDLHEVISIHRDSFKWTEGLEYFYIECICSLSLRMVILVVVLLHLSSKIYSTHEFLC